MSHLNMIKMGISVLAALSGNPEASPAELAVALYNKTRKAKEKHPIRPCEHHCDVCHEAHARRLAA